MDVEYTCYHGTDREAAKNILKTKIFKCSTGNREWAGEGVYFFIDWTDNESNAAANALKWAKMRRRVKTHRTKPRIPIVIEVTFRADIDNILDLTDPAMQEIFHQCRDAYFETVKDRLQDIGVPNETSPLEIQDAGELDCLIIDSMCEDYHYCAVVKRCYINFGGSIKELGIRRLPNSFIPNCTILALRDQTLIKNIEEYNYET